MCVCNRHARNPHDYDDDDDDELPSVLPQFWLDNRNVTKPKPLVTAEKEILKSPVYLNESKLKSYGKSYRPHIGNESVPNK